MQSKAIMEKKINNLIKICRKDFSLREFFNIHYHRFTVVVSKIFTPIVSNLDEALRSIVKLANTAV